MIEQACKNCGLLITSSVCPNCNKSTLSRDWIGELIVLEPEKSILAKRIEAKKRGRYALRVR